MPRNPRRRLVGGKQEDARHAKAEERLEAVRREVRVAQARRMRDDAVIEFGLDGELVVVDLEEVDEAR